MIMWVYYAYISVIGLNANIGFTVSRKRSLGNTVEHEQENTIEMIKKKNLLVSSM